MKNTEKEIDLIQVAGKEHWIVLFLTETFTSSNLFSCQSSLHQCPIFIYASSWGWTVSPLEAVVPRHIVSSHTKNKSIVTSYVEIIWLVQNCSGIYLNYAKNLNQWSKCSNATSEYDVETRRVGTPWMISLRYSRLKKQRKRNIGLRGRLKIGVY